MNEEDIVAKLADNLPKPPEPVAPVEEKPTGVQEHGSVDYGLDETVQYKMHEFFDEDYKPSDYAKKEAMGFIYKEIANMVPGAEHVDVMHKMRDMLQISGLAHSNNKVQKFSEWLRLRSIANNAHKRMEVLSYEQR